MISPKLISLLENFSRNERNTFYKFIQSPFHNENNDLVKLYEIIDREIQHIGWGKNNNSRLSKEIVWKKIKGTTPYVDEPMRRMSSDLSKKIYSFLAYQKFKENPLNELVYLLPKINHPKLDKHFSGILRQAKHLKEKSTLKNAEHHFSNYKIESQKYLNAENLNSKLSSFENLEQADYHLDAFYIFNKLKNYCDLLAYKNVTASQPSILLFPNFLESIKKSPFIHEPCVKTYLLIVSMLLHPNDDSHFFKAKNVLKETHNCFTKKELNTIYIYLKNYCIDTKINNGKSEYFHELFDIFKTLLDKEINLTNGLIGPQDYKNIITVGLHIKEFDWTENFIQYYTQRLPKENQDNDLNYNLAKVYFHKEEYEKVIEQLRSVEYKNLSYALGGKMMLLKTYYELEEVSPLSSLLDSYSIYLRRNKLISRELKQQYLNVLRFTRKLSSLAPYDQAGLQKLKTQINNCKALAAKKWLLEKVEELEK